MFINRFASESLVDTLNTCPCVALLGPRQVGKTTLAHQLAQQTRAVYLDLDSPRDRKVLEDPDHFFQSHRERLVILDEIHRTPEIFSQLRGEIDRARMQGIRDNMFLILGSASMDLLRQTRESLAGRIGYIQLDPINIIEAHSVNIEPECLWLRGGFPDSLLTSTDADSLDWRFDFIRTFVERDIPMFSARSLSSLIEQLWTMLAHSQGSVVNYASLAKSLEVSAPTVRSYIELLEKLFLLRTLRPFHTNLKKQYVKSPKIFVRDSGLTHALLHLQSGLQLYKHPVVGYSWEGFVIENVLSVVPYGTQSFFYRTAKGAEVDLILRFPGLQETWAIEIKRNLAARSRRGFMIAKRDVQANRCFIVNTGSDRISLSPDTEAIGLLELCQDIQKLTSQPQINGV